MKSKAIILAAALCVLFATNANATFPDELYWDAGCEGWAFWGHFYFGPTSESVAIDYTVELEQGSVTVLTITGSGVVYPADPNFNFSGTWGMELCGEYSVHMHMHFAASDGWGDRYYDTSFYCECDGGECTYTPGYWKNHPEAWPVENLTVGGVSYTKAELLEIFGWPTKGDITIILFHHLVAAKLNVLAGADDYIQDAIDAGDAFLVTFPLGSAPTGMDKLEGEGIKNDLAAYNEIPCDDGDDFDMLSGVERTPLGTSAVEEKSWGDIKRLYK